MDRIKDTLEDPNRIIEQKDKSLIFVKDYKEKNISQAWQDWIMENG